APPLYLPSFPTRRSSDLLEVSLARPDWLNLGLAYCVSIHKSQGSEYQLVILPLTMDNRRMLQRKLLYTAVTRAKDKLVMIGQKEDRKSTRLNSSHVSISY